MLAGTAQGSPQDASGEVVQPVVTVTGRALERDRTPSPDSLPARSPTALPQARAHDGAMPITPIGAAGLPPSAHPSPSPACAGHFATGPRRTVRRAVEAPTRRGEAVCGLACLTFEVRFVVVNGPPGSGKSTLAAPLVRVLGLPCIAKDTIKEALGDALDIGGEQWTTVLSKASFEVLWAVADRCPEAVLEGNFYPGSAERLRSLDQHAVEIFCRCPIELCRARFAERLRREERHRVHPPVVPPEGVLRDVRPTDGRRPGTRGPDRSRRGHRRDRRVDQQQPMISPRAKSSPVSAHRPRRAAGPRSVRPTSASSSPGKPQARCDVRDHGQGMKMLGHEGLTKGGSGHSREREPAHQEGRPRRSEDSA